MDPRNVVRSTNSYPLSSANQRAGSLGVVGNQKNMVRDPTTLLTARCLYNDLMEKHKACSISRLNSFAGCSSTWHEGMNNSTTVTARFVTSQAHDNAACYKHKSDKYPQEVITLVHQRYMQHSCTDSPTRRDHHARASSLTSTPIFIKNQTNLKTH